MDETLLQLGEKAEQALQVLGEKLGQGAEYVWPILVRQQFVYGIMLSVGAIIGALVLTAGVTMLIKNNNNEGLIVGGSAFTLFGLVGFIICTVCAINYLANPEYHAIQEVFNLIK